MLGFIKKDLLMLKSNSKVIIFITIIYILSASQNSFSFIGLPAFVSVMLMFASFSYDNYNNWNAYAITLPNGRRNTILSKYLTAFILIILTSIFTFLLTLVISLFKDIGLDFKELIFSLLITDLVTFLLTAIFYPIIFKFGIEKARFIIVGLIFIPFIILSIIPSSFNFSLKLPKIITHILLYSSPFIILILCYLSYLLSKKIYNKKEL